MPVDRKGYRNLFFSTQHGGDDVNWNPPIISFNSVAMVRQRSICGWLRQHCTMRGRWNKWNNRTIIKTTLTLPLLWLQLSIPQKDATRLTALTFRTILCESWKELDSNSRSVGCWRWNCIFVFHRLEGCNKKNSLHQRQIWSWISQVTEQQVEWTNTTSKNGIEDDKDLNHGEKI